MRGNQDFQGAMFSYISLEERVPATHPLRKLRAAVDALLATMNREFDAVYARRGRPSVPPEMLLKALLLQILFSIRSERQLVEAVNYNLLYRWFVGLNIEDKVWDHSTFSANRERLFNEDLARAFFERVKLSAQWGKLASDEHFSVDGTLIDAWASHKSFKRKDDDSGTPPGRNPEVDFKGQERCNDTHKSTTDSNARLFKKSQGDKSRLCHMGHILMENRNGLIVDVEITHASGTAEREAALAMLERRGNRNKRATVGADKGYDSDTLIEAIEHSGAQAVIPPRRNRLTPRYVDWHRYKARNLVERFFNRLKQFRRLATRYDKLDRRFGAFLCLACAYI